MKKILLGLMLFTGIVKGASFPQGPSVAANSDYTTVSFSASDLGLSLPVSVSAVTSPILTFTVNVQGYSEVSIFIQFSITATAAANSCFFTLIPQDLAGKLLYDSVTGITSTAAQAGTPASPIFVAGNGIQTYYATINTQTPVGHFKTPTGAGAINLAASIGQTWPAYSFVLANSSLNASGFVYYVTNVIVFARKRTF